MLDRRSLLVSASAGAAALVLPRLADAQAPSPIGPLFDQFFQERLRLRPESATQLGLDKGPNADLKRQLSDQSPAGLAAAKAETASQLRRLLAVDRAKLSAADQVSYDTVRYSLESTARVQAFEFGGNAFGPSPYVVSQLTGPTSRSPTSSTPSTGSRPATTPRPMFRASRPSRNRSTTTPIACATTRGWASSRRTSCST